MTLGPTTEIEANATMQFGHYIVLAVHARPRGWSTLSVGSQESDEQHPL